ncbi:hypothetical protein LSM04_006559 [Trypanosoma melophagium]|uniref:uncharacterized protein n=1 Tax=Trypanosoma melophagium TaxID=715481 RepID=UPI00351A61D7|nr:hypothetical protein LSM04_006559 [Trypanosoma melophagium]
MELPEEIVVGKTTLTLAKSSCAVQSVDNVGKQFNTFCFVGESWAGGAVEWFLSPLEGYEEKKLRVEEAVVDEHVHNCGVFLRMGDFTFRQYQVKNESADRVNNANISCNVIEEDKYDASLCNTPRSLYFLSRSTTQGGEDTPSCTRAQYITMDNTDVCGENNNASQCLSLIPSSNAAGELRGSEIIIQQQAEEDNKPKTMQIRSESFLPPIVPPKKPQLQLEPNVRGSGSFRSRRLLSAQQNQKQQASPVQSPSL